MTETEASFNLTCFDDDFDKHIEEINEYYECKFRITKIYKHLFLCSVRCSAYIFAHLRKISFFRFRNS